MYMCARVCVSYLFVLLNLARVKYFDVLLALGYIIDQVLATPTLRSCFLPYRSVKSFLTVPWLRGKVVVQDDEHSSFKILITALSVLICS